MPNFTLDDTDSTLSYSADGWAVQLPTDPDLDRFFDKTYHAAQADQATMTFTFQGSGFAVYGSKGPGHGKFQVQFDNTVVNLDASAPTAQFQQELFAHTFEPANASATHLVKLTAVLSGDGLQGRWLDVDYITFSSGSASAAASAIGTVTSLPPWLSGSSSQASPTSSASGSAFTPAVSTTTSSTSKVPTILAALFGGLIGLALVLLLLYCVLTRVYARDRARERVFRYGQSSANPSVSLAGTYAHSAAGSGKSAGPSAAFSNSAAAGAGALMDLVPLRRNSNAGARDGSVSSEMRSMSLDVHGASREGAASPAVSGGGGAGGGAGGSAGRPLLSTSPIVWTRQKKHKGDADSLRTDFLQV